jgi:hypothetical protein
MIIISIKELHAAAEPVHTINLPQQLRRYVTYAIPFPSIKLYISRSKTYNGSCHRRKEYRGAYICHLLSNISFALHPRPESKIYLVDHICSCTGHPDRELSIRVHQSSLQQYKHNQVQGSNKALEGGASNWHY